MDPKLTLLFVLIGAIVALSHLGRESAQEPRRSLVSRRWRQILRRT
ncbi:MAG TPA: hypothetical protein VN655_13260 [Pseudolabrys sp.]|nr:hypothetical protein [Pseudolabrys sp.]